MNFYDSSSSGSFTSGRSQDSQLKLLYEESKPSTPTIETASSQWTSLESLKKKSTKQLLGFEIDKYGEVIASRICPHHIAVSDSRIIRHPYYRFPVVKDPRIRDALHEDDETQSCDDDGQVTYLKVCKDMCIPVVKTIYKSLLRKSINLKYYGITPPGLKAMCVALEWNKTVSMIDLSDNPLDRDSCYHLGKLITSNENIVDLNLNSCKIGPTNIDFVIHDLPMSKIRVLNLGKNDLWDKGIDLLGDILCKSATVQSLNLSHNLIGTTGALHLADTFDYANNIRHLDLSWNFIEARHGITNLLTSLSESKALEQLIFSWNGLTGTEAIGNRIANLIQRVETLNLVDFSGNRLCDNAIRCIADALPLCVNLRTLILSMNPMSPEDAYYLLQSMKNENTPVENLILEDVWVDQRFVELKEKIVSMRKCVIKHGGEKAKYLISGADPRKLLLMRGQFLGQKGKPKLKVDIGQFFLNLRAETPKLGLEILKKRIKTERIHLNDDFLDELAVVFAGSRRGEQPLVVDLDAIADYIHRIWPEKEAQPPSPEPEEPQPGKVAGKDKKSKPKETPKAAKTKATVGVVHCHRKIPLEQQEVKKRIKIIKFTKKIPDPKTLRRIHATTRLNKILDKL